MAVERKCPSCGTWNKELDYCSKCGTVLSFELIEEEREKVREKRRYRPPSQFDRFIQRWKTSEYLFLRVTYKIVYAIGFAFFAIASFFAWLAASPNG